MIVRKTILSVALVTAMLSLLPMGAHAQAADPLSVSHKRKPKEDSSSQAQENKFPKATRTEPKIVQDKFSDKIAKISDQLKDNKNDEAIAGAEAILADSKANNMDRAQAAYIAGFAALNKNGQDYSQPISYFQRALSEDGLPNNIHYPVMLNVAQMQLGDEKYAEALATAQRFLSETQVDDPKAYAVEGNALYRLERYPEAVVALKKVLSTSDPAVDNNSVVQMLISSYMEMKQPNEAAAMAEDLAAKKPDDKNAQMVVANIYIEADQPAKAGAIFDRLRSKGMLTESKDYENGYRLLANIPGREKDAISLINEGLDKKILNPSAEVYSLLGQSYYDADQIPQAVAAWEKGGAMAQDGELYLNVAKLQSQEQHWAEAKAAAHQALDKGVQKPGEAWMEIARAEQATGNKAGMMAAFREAAKHPETQAQANKALKQSGAK